MFAAPFPVGANGVVLEDNVMTNSNTNVGRIVAVPVDADGTNSAMPGLLAHPLP